MVRDGVRLEGRGHEEQRPVHHESMERPLEKAPVDEPAGKSQNQRQENERHESDLSYEHLLGSLSDVPRDCLLSRG